MDWLSNAFWARVGWAAGDLAISASVAFGIMLVLALIILPRLIRQSLCSHAHYHETSSCDAICNDCGRNLGFIGRIRDHQ
jgi:hypothetical protein